MSILFYFGHPSQYLFLRSCIKILKENNIKCQIIIKSKDVLEQLIYEDKESYINILPEGRRSNKLGILIGLIKRDFRLLSHVINKKYDLFVGSDPSIAHVGYIFRIPVITVIEDDIDVIAGLAKITYPFSSHILAPEGCKTGKYEKKTLHYKGYMKLAYLHPNYFKKKHIELIKPYCLIRVSKLNAYHDKGIKGFSLTTLKEVVNLIEGKKNVYISSEGELDDSLLKYKLNIKPSLMQQVLSNAELLISDSQSMTMEAAILGVPSIRFSDFVGKISVLNELENHYGLTYGITTQNSAELFTRINSFLSGKISSEEYKLKREKMLEDKIDVTAFIVWLLKEYPRSVDIFKKNPEIQLEFK
jgi:predicted glycosyltransferase